MSSLWPWLVVAGAGVLHGLHPATGWVLAAGCALRAHDATQARRALLPIGLGHALSVATVAAAVALGAALDRGALAGLVMAGLPIAVVLHRWRGRLSRSGLPTAASTTLALTSFATATLHGAGLMLVPALVPLCIADTPARTITASGSLLLALAAVGVHLAAMLVVTALMAAGACRAVQALRRRRRGRRSLQSLVTSR